MQKERNQVLLQAWSDYDESVVAINEKKLLSLNITPEHKNILANQEFEVLNNKSLKEATRFLIGLNSVNYQFWDLIDNRFVRYQNKKQVGALGSYAGFQSLYEVLEKNNFDTSILTTNLLIEHFGDISDKEKRVEILKEALDPQNFEAVSQEINNHIQHSSINVELAHKISTLMPLSYEDPYLKKIQLALYEIAQIYQTSGIEVNCEVTVAADYQIPKVLEGLGVLVYHPSLSQKIDNFELIEENSKEEKALRAATIIACEYIADAHNISIPALDRLLWLARNDFKNKNFHLTKTSNY